MHLASALRAADTLDIWVIDVDGGKAEIIRTPSGQAVLIDAGFPRPDDRDIKRIELAAKDAGITAFDYLIISHYDVDHVGNVPAISTHFNFKAYVDHGPLIIDPKTNPANTKAANAYLAFIPGKNRITVKPGDVLPLSDVRVTILTSNAQVLQKPLPGAGKPNTACPEPPPEPVASDDNPGSVGELWQFGNFRMADFGDLIKWVENRLVCPVNEVGPIDLFMVNQHGVAASNSPELVAALHPKVAIMNNGDRKGNSAATVNTLRAQPGLQDVWQLHFSPALGAELNPPENFIANMTATEDEAKWIRVSARKDGSFTITNTRNGFSKEYK